jgi:intracellular sulfur oxidation DsrE/DsrF family protein
MKIMHILQSGYRGTLEEQDDTILWFTHVLRGAGAEITVLLTGGAVNYAAVGQDASGLRIGGWAQSHPPDIAADVSSLMGKGVEVIAVKEDLADRGLHKAPLLDGVKQVKRDGVADLFARHDCVWRW